MATEVKVVPALTAEEWAKLETAGDVRWDDPKEGACRIVADWSAPPDFETEYEVVLVYGEGGFRYDIADRHGAAALCLHGQPFGFTREDVEALREAIGHIDPSLALHTDGRYTDETLTNLADRIEALLPPEE